MLLLNYFQNIAKEEKLQHGILLTLCLFLIRKWRLPPQIRVMYYSAFDSQGAVVILSAPTVRSNISVISEMSFRIYN